MLAPFGKYEGVTANYIAVCDISYAFWMLKNVKELKSSYPLFHSQLTNCAHEETKKIINYACDNVLKAIIDVEFIYAFCVAKFEANLSMGVEPMLLESKPRVMTTTL